MGNEELKTRIFQFIDVFPQLTSAESVLRHIQEYFPHSAHRIPRSIRAGLLLTRPALLTKNAVQYLTRTMFLKIARLFVAAADESEAIHVLEEFQKQGITSSIDLLGEKTISGPEADQCIKRVEALIQEFGKRKLGPGMKNISVKLSALEPQFDPLEPEETSRRVRERLRPLIRRAPFLSKTSVLRLLPLPAPMKPILP